MDENIYDIYVKSRKLISDTQKGKADYSDLELNLIADIKLSITLMDEFKPEYKARYNSSIQPALTDWKIGKWQSRRGR